MGLLPFLIYINDLALIINRVTEVILFADDTGIIISNIQPEEFKNNMNIVTKQTIDWLHSNLLALNSNKTYFLQFLNKKHNEMKIQIMVSNSVISNTTSTKCLGPTMDGTLSWKDHILDLTTKLNKACFAIRPIKSLMYVIKCFENSLLFIFPRINVVWYYILGKLLPL